MGREGSVATTRSSLLPTVRTQIDSTPFEGARYASIIPLGEIAGAAFSGFPKRTARGMSGGRSARAGGAVNAKSAVSVAAMAVRLLEADIEFSLLRGTDPVVRRESNTTELCAVHRYFESSAPSSFPSASSNKV